MNPRPLARVRAALKEGQRTGLLAIQYRLTLLDCPAKVACRRLFDMYDAARAELAKVETKLEAQGKALEAGDKLADEVYKASAEPDHDPNCLTCLLTLAYRAARAKAGV